ncbi:hypothetical protein [Terriglobus aquaticus]|uniref:Multisubunit Na+/H+ antiporter, MnhE subunit n=1 Tax=Terriglobus aquaticus TaxID=940139 RepID=A0ABW9KIY2_9BACT|nr:hypothetical protein [Terriglobus aquaticus]
MFASALVLVLALWMLFTGSKQAHEWVAGAFSIACTLSLLIVVYREQSQTFDLRWSDALALWRTPWYVVSGIVEITVVLLKDLAGHRAESIFRVCGFRTAKEDPLLVTRRALATAYTSIAPNFIVLGVDHQQSRMLFHQIQRSSVPRMTKQLGAEVGTREDNPGDAAAQRQQKAEQQ